MVFGFFKKHGNAEVDPPPSAKPPETQAQLRTPSPSIDSTSVANGVPASVSPSLLSDALPGGPESSTLPSTRPTGVAPEPTPQALDALIASVPPKILHAYIIGHLPNASPDTLATLAAFFTSLTPPPRLHCVRCHKDYVEVENDDRSCLVPHDDESAEVERVGRSAKRDGRRMGDVGPEYETLWGCCGKTVEGDGDQGPPDGWCYEGKHTTDSKRARFRADATPHDDKLVSCLRLNCHGIRSQLPRARSSRKRPHSMNLKEPDTDDEGTDGETDSGVEEIVSGRAKKGKGKAKVKASEEDMDMDEDESVSQTGRGRAAGKATATPSTSAVKRRGRPTKPVVERETEDESASAARSAPAVGKRKGRAPKSKAYIDDSDEDVSRSPHSASRTASPKKVVPIAAASSTKSISQTLVRTAREISPELGVADEPKPKKRKTAIA